MKVSSRFSMVASMALLGCLSAPVSAGPQSKVYTPVVEYGETELEWYGGTYLGEQAVDGESGTTIAIGYGFTPWWKSEVEFEWHAATDGSLHYDALAWTNVLQLTEPGQYWLDMGWYAEFVFPNEESEAKVIETGPMFQKEIGSSMNNLNLIFVRDYGHAAAHETELEYTWQSRWKGNPQLEWGVQGMGELGRWAHMPTTQNQEHKLGPALFGQIAAGSHSKVKYDAALLFGVTDDTPDKTLRFQIEYEMP